MREMFLVDCESIESEIAVIPYCVDDQSLGQQSISTGSNFMVVGNREQWLDLFLKEMRRVGRMPISFLHEDGQLSDNTSESSDTDSSED